MEKIEQEKGMNVKFRDKVFIAFLCETMPTNHFLLSCTDMIALNGHTCSKAERQKINYITGNRRYSYTEYVSMFSDINFELLHDIDILLNVYNKYPKQFKYVLVIYYHLQQKGEMNLTQLIKYVDFSKATFYTNDLETILNEYPIFKVYDYTDENNNTHKMFSLNIK